jgi:ADP-ribose pyrophosphatase YjhB (NUDIX family)
MKDYVRPLAIAVIRRDRDNAILVCEGYDSHKGEIFYRPLGGTIEFGEPSEQTVHRELHEEVGLELCDVRYLATIENIFTYQGQTGHEIVMVYGARLAGAMAQAYDQDEIQGSEDNGQPFVARWMPLSHFGPDGPPLYPTGLLELLIDET